MTSSFKEWKEKTKNIKIESDPDINFEIQYVSPGGILPFFKMKYKNNCISIQDGYIDKEINQRLIDKIKNCKKRFFLIMLTIPILFDKRGNYAHENMVVLDNVEKIIEHFEPEGEYSVKAIDYVKKLSDIIKYKIHELPCLKFQGGTEGSEEMYCVAWSLWYANLRLSNPDSRSSELLKKAYNEHSKSFTTFINNYSHYIVKIVNEKNKIFIKLFDIAVKENDITLFEKLLKNGLLAIINKYLTDQGYDLEELFEKGSIKMIDLFLFYNEMEYKKIPLESLFQLSLQENRPDVISLIFKKYKPTKNDLNWVQPYVYEYSDDRNKKAVLLFLKLRDRVYDTNRSPRNSKSPGGFEYSKRNLLGPGSRKVKTRSVVHRKRSSAPTWSPEEEKKLHKHKTI